MGGSRDMSTIITDDMMTLGLYFDRLIFLRTRIPALQVHQALLIIQLEVAEKYQLSEIVF